jgi:hypothetical protein
MPDGSYGGKPTWAAMSSAQYHDSALRYMQHDDWIMSTVCAHPTLIAASGAAGARASLPSAARLEGYENCWAIRSTTISREGRMYIAHTYAVPPPLTPPQLRGRQACGPP